MDGTQLCRSLSKSPADAVEVLSGCLTAVVKWLEGNELKLNPNKMEVILAGQAEILKDIVLPIFSSADLCWYG